jgi:hypothetical protein
MNRSDNNFEPLRQLLALKRHESPPPGYFDDFPSLVMSRIRAGEADVPRGMAERLFAEAPWLMKFLQVFEAKPAFVGAFACTLCLLLLFGIIYAERPDATPKTALLAAVTQSAVPLTDVTAPVLTPSPGQQPGLMVSTNPVIGLEPVVSLFSQQNPLVQPVSASLPIPSN